MSEKDIEKYLVQEVKKAGGKAYKWVSPGNNGVPDRIVILPDEVILFVELKAPGKYPTVLQEKKHNELRKLGCQVFVIDSKENIDRLIQCYKDVSDSERG